MQHVRRFTPRTLLGSLMLGVALLSGCASTGSSLLSGTQADDRLASGQDAKFFSRSGFQACAGAAAVGVLACMLSNSSNKAACAIIAGVAACGVAMGTNYYLDQRRTEYANTSDRLAAMQRDVKRLVAYSSVAHLGFIVLGTFALTTQGIQGGVMQMVNHGISTGALFLLDGRVVGFDLFDRAATLRRLLPKLVRSVSAIDVGALRTASCGALWGSDGA